MVVLRFVKEREPLQSSLASDLPNSPIPSAFQIEDRDFSPRPTAELVASVEGLTEIAATSASQRHLGLWHRVEGPVVNVREEVSGSVITVYIKESMDEVSVFLDFDNKRWGARLMSLNVGDHISAIGKIDSISYAGFLSLGECELLD